MTLRDEENLPLSAKCEANRLQRVKRQRVLQCQNPPRPPLAPSFRKVMVVSMPVALMAVVIFERYFASGYDAKTDPLWLVVAVAIAGAIFIFPLSFALAAYLRKCRK